VDASNNQPKNNDAQDNSPALKNTPISFSLAKEPPGNGDAQQSDAQYGLIAISDGATQSIFAEEWADLLTQGFCQSQEPTICEHIRDNWQTWLKPLQNAWIPIYEQARSKPQQANKWNSLKSTSARANTAAATFVGLQILPTDENGRGKWKSVAIGDSCLFQFRQIKGKPELQKAFPLEKSQDFSTATHAFNSNPKYSVLSKAKPVFFEGEYQLGDTFFLATDALAQWLLKNRELGQDDWRKLLEVKDQSEFERMVDDLRKTNQIVFDDTTFTRMQVVTSPEEKQPVTKNVQLSASTNTSDELLNQENSAVSSQRTLEEEGLWAKLSTFTTILLGWLGIKEPKQESADSTESMIAQVDAKLKDPKVRSLSETLPMVDTLENIYGNVLHQKQTQGTLIHDDSTKKALDALLVDIKQFANNAQSSQQPVTGNISTGIKIPTTLQTQPQQSQPLNPQFTQPSPPQSQNGSGTPQSTFSSSSPIKTSVIATSTTSNIGTSHSGSTPDAPKTAATTPSPAGKQKTQSVPFWKNKKFLKTAAIVGTAVAAVGAIAYAISQGHDQLPHIEEAKKWHDALSSDISTDGTLSKASWEHLANASPQELQSLAKQDPALAQRLQAAIADHLEAQGRAGELLDLEKLKALRESGGVALKDFIPSDEQATLKFINETFEQHGLEGNFKSFAEAQQYVSSQAAEQYNNIDISLVQDTGTTYRQFDNAQKTLSGNAVYDQIKQQWESQGQELQRAKDTLPSAVSSVGSSILEEARQEGGTLNASADTVYLEPQHQGFNWAAAASTGMAAGKVVTKGVVSHALPIVGAALTTYSISKSTYDHLMTKADKLGILTEREGSTVKERLQHAPKDLARVVNQAVADAPQDFRDMCDRFHQTSKNIMNVVKSRFSSLTQQERSQVELMAMTQKAATR
jgi:hypothetical protein